MDANAFCGFCGTKYASADWPRTCGNCRRETYQNALPVAVLLQPVYKLSGLGAGLVVVRRAIEPKRGEWALPGGYIGHEDWRHAAAREGKEEANLDVPNWSRIEPFDTHSRPDGRVILSFGIAPGIRLDALPEFVPNDEVSERDILWQPRTLAFQTHTKVVTRFFRPLFFLR